MPRNSNSHISAPSTVFPGKAPLLLHLPTGLTPGTCVHWKKPWRNFFPMLFLSFVSVIEVLHETKKKKKKPSRQVITSYVSYFAADQLHTSHGRPSSHSSNRRSRNSALNICAPNAVGLRMLHSESGWSSSALVVFLPENRKSQSSQVKGTLSSPPQLWG